MHIAVTTSLLRASTPNSTMNWEDKWIFPHHWKPQVHLKTNSTQLLKLAFTTEFSCYSFNNYLLYVKTKQKPRAHKLGLTDMSLNPDSSLTVWPQTDQLTPLNAHFHVSKNRARNAFKMSHEDRIRKSLHGKWPAPHRARCSVPYMTGHPSLKRGRHCRRVPTTNWRGWCVRKTTVLQQPSPSWFSWNHLRMMKLPKSLHTGHW